MTLLNVVLCVAVQNLLFFLVSWLLLALRPVEYTTWFSTQTFHSTMWDQVTGLPGDMQHMAEHLPVMATVILSTYGLVLFLFGPLVFISVFAANMLLERWLKHEGP